MNGFLQSHGVERAFIERLRVTNYGPIRDADFRLTPIHAFIGPNDSGKSSILRAIETLARLGAGQTRDDLVRRLLLSARPDREVALRASVRTWTWTVQVLRGSEQHFTLEQNGKRVGTGNATLPNYPEPHGALRGAQLVRFDPDALRSPTDLIPHGAPMQFRDERGLGLPSLYDALLSRDLDGFIAVRNRMRQLFPAVESLELRNTSSTEKTLAVKLTTGETISSEDMSEGLLYYLGFAVLPHVAGTAVLLVEEPENGLHPARIAEVVTLLRDIARTTQVLIATHSPLVVNELASDEISVVTRDPDEGTKVTPLSATANYEERSQAYSNGELWVSYADGNLETPLLKGGPRP